jgi:hypothetical protein
VDVLTATDREAGIDSLLHESDYVVLATSLGHDPPPDRMSRPDEAISRHREHRTRKRHDEAALIEALKAGQIRGAGLDVSRRSRYRRTARLNPERPDDSTPDPDGARSNGQPLNIVLENARYCQPMVNLLTREDMFSK